MGFVRARGLRYDIRMTSLVISSPTGAVLPVFQGLGRFAAPGFVQRRRQRHRLSSALNVSNPFAFRVSVCAPVGRCYA